jgi:hypothetical protein
MAYDAQAQPSTPEPWTLCLLANYHFPSGCGQIYSSVKPAFVKVVA